ncbi:hypothetical protein ACLB2K_061428 [Fragaria x ananassa]
MLWVNTCGPKYFYIKKLYGLQPTLQQINNSTITQYNTILDLVEPQTLPGAFLSFPRTLSEAFSVFLSFPIEALLDPTSSIDIVTLRRTTVSPCPVRKANLKNPAVELVLSPSSVA